MLIKEYRVILPVTVEEYHVAQLYMVAKASEEATNSGEGIEIVKNEPYDNEKGKGQYTEKILHLSSKVPGWLKTLAPSDALKIYERAWNSYPYCKTEYECPYLGSKFHLSVESIHKDNAGSDENPLNLTGDDLKERKVEVIDVATSEPKPSCKEEDVTIFHSKKAPERTPLTAGWQKKVKPVMCCYKVVKFEFKVWGLQTKVEQFVHKVGLHDVFLNSHRKLVTWMDEWLGLTIDDIRKLEAETKARNDKAFEEAKQHEAEHAHAHGHGHGHSHGHHHDGGSSCNHHH